tara:strand:+ start:777 stop:1556 length:780 start_codon:yes stop_codon:yes gene_type:complete
MRLENNPSKAKIRRSILEQIKSELKENPVDSYIVSLPASNWKFETMLITTLNCLYPSVKFTLHCFENNHGTFWENTKGKNSANLPFEITKREDYFVYGKELNVEIIYQWGGLNADDINNGCKVRNQRLILWADYCCYPIDYPEKKLTPMKNLTFFLNNFDDALIYQTNCINLRTFSEGGRWRGFGFVTGRPKVNANKILSYYRKRCPSRNRIRRSEIFEHLYKGGDPVDGRAPSTPMFTFGWRTGSANASHIEKETVTY